MRFDPFLQLETERLLLQQPTNEDVSFIFQLRSSEEVNRYLDRDAPKDPEEARQFIERVNTGISQNKSLYWMLRLKENKTTIGTICLWNFSEDLRMAETGYELLPAFQSKGFMYEALGAVVHYGLNRLGLQEIQAYTHRNNAASARLLEKHGFQQKTLPQGHEYPDELLFGLYKRI